MKRFFSETKKLLILGFLILTNLSFGADRYIQHGADGDDTGLDWDNAYPSFAAAVYTAGNTYHVGASTEYQGHTFTAVGTEQNPIKIIAVTDPFGNSPAEVQSCVTINGSYITFSGFLVTPNSDDGSGAVYLTGNNNIVTNCWIKDYGATTFDQSWALHTDGSYNLAIDCQITDIVDSDAIALFGTENIIQSCIISNIQWVLRDDEQGHNHVDLIQNWGDNYPGDVAYYNKIDGCTFIDSYCQIGNVTDDANPDVEGTTVINSKFIRVDLNQISFSQVNAIWANNIFYRCGSGDTYPSQVTAHPIDMKYSPPGWNYTGTIFVNNIFFDNGRNRGEGGLSFSGSGGTSKTLRNNYYAHGDYTTKTFSIYDSEGEINGGDPGFTDISELDFTLVEGSPLIGAGYDMSAYFTEDFNGDTRSTWDIGPYVYGAGDPTVARPVITQAEGPYWFDQSTTITCATPGASIYYTTDGSTPTAGSTLYTTPITIDQSMTIKAIGILVDYNDSAVETSVYEIREWVGTVAWKSFLITDQTETFPFSVNVTPTSSDIDLVLGFNDSQISGYEGCLVGIRFSYLGVVDARNGAIYDAENVFNYGAQTYTVAGTVNLTTDTYSFTVNGTTIADNYSFRDSGTLANVEWFGFVESENTSVVTINNLQFDPAPPTHLRQVKAASYIMNTFQ